MKLIFISAFLSLLLVGCVSQDVKKDPPILLSCGNKDCDYDNNMVFPPFSSDKEVVFNISFSKFYPAGAKDFEHSFRVFKEGMKLFNYRDDVTENIWIGEDLRLQAQGVAMNWENTTDFEIRVAGGDMGVYKGWEVKRVIGHGSPWYLMTWQPSNDRSELIVKYTPLDDEQFDEYEGWIDGKVKQRKAAEAQNNPPSKVISDDEYQAWIDKYYDMSSMTRRIYQRRCALENSTQKKAECLKNSVSLLMSSFSRDTFTQAGLEIPPLEMAIEAFRAYPE